VCVFTGCGVKTEYGHTVHYIYVNESSSEITVRSVIPMEHKGDIEYKFTLPLSNRHTMTIFSEGYARPFWNALGSNEDYVVVSNGSKTVTQRFANGDELYFGENYTLISENNRVKTMQYVFTDEFFENGEPIE
jgi:hypothetical protein